MLRVRSEGRPESEARRKVGVGLTEYTEGGNGQDLASTYVLHPLVRLAVCPIISEEEVGGWSLTGGRREEN